jgi:hypothetical protein
LVARPYNEPKLGSRFFGFQADGKIRWQFEPGRAVVDRSGDQMIPPYFPSAIQVVRGKTPAETRIVISSYHYLAKSNQVAFPDVNGRLVAEYWHGGHLLYSDLADLDGNGRIQLLLGGVNNGNHQATLVVLDPLKVSGIVTPKEMTDPRFELLSMSAANERAVILFPRSCLSTGQPYTE